MERSGDVNGGRLRRVITGNDDRGRSIVVDDGPPSRFLEFFPGAGLYDIWTAGRNTATEDTVGPLRLQPPRDGVTCRWFTVLPEPAGTTRTDLAAFYDNAFAAMTDRDVRPDISRHPGMHRTETLDFIIVISGCVRLVLDDDERLLGPGDVVVQRLTNHTWICLGDAPALLVGVLIDESARSHPPMGDSHR